MVSEELGIPLRPGSMNIVGTVLHKRSWTEMLQRSTFL